MYTWLSDRLDGLTTSVTIGLVFFAAVVVVVLAIIIFLNRFNKGNLGVNKKKHSPRLAICEMIGIDRARYLVLVRRDDMEHLILIGGPVDVVVESNAINTCSTHKSTYEQRDSVRTTTKKNNKNPSDTGRTPVLINEAEHMYETPTSFLNQYLEDPATTANAEGRQEPFLSVPTRRK
ncbi:hypothetical protein [Bartonella sp. CB178]|uniref:hypothetical protein n=1 Tax=Bartonella sp. CB178 TaxID=3112255 RepID=UPI00300E4FBA